MSEKLKTIIVGLGKIGLEYDLKPHNGQVLTHTKAMLAHPGFDLVCGVDPDAAQRKKFTSVAGKQAYAGLSQVPKDTVCDVVVMALPPRGRTMVLKQCLNFKPRLVLMEKPLAHSVKEGRTIVDLCRYARMDLMINYMRRCEPAVQNLRARIVRKEWGRFQGGHVYYTRGLHNNASHFVDLLSYWLGVPSTWGIIKGDKKQGQGDPSPDFWMIYAGRRCVFQAISQDAFSIGKLELIFDKAVLQYDDFGRDVTIKMAETDPHYAGYQRLAHEPERIPTDFKRCQWYVADHVYQHLIRGIDLISTGQSALRTLTICEDVVNQCQN